MNGMRMDGFTTWELMIVVALVVFLFVAALENLLPLRGAAERAAVMNLVGKLRGAVGFEATRRVLDDGAPALDAMDGADPMRWLLAAPATHAGAVGNWNDIPPGGWGFDPLSGILFYRVRYPQYFTGDFMQPPGIRFRVDVARGTSGSIETIALVQVDAAAWTFDTALPERLAEPAQ